MIKNWVLVEPTLGETPEQPGGLFREVRDGDGFRIELLVGRKTWEDRTALLAPYVFAGEGGAFQTDPVHAQLLEMTYPWPHARHFKKQRVRYNQNHGDGGRFDSSDPNFIPPEVRQNRAITDWVTNSQDARRMREQIAAHDKNSKAPMDDDARNLKVALENAPLSTETLYRGMSVTPELRDLMDTPGFQFNLAAGSFSESEQRATGFSSGGRGTERVIIELEPGAHALPIDYQAAGGKGYTSTSGTAFGTGGDKGLHASVGEYSNEKESIVRGNFVVVSSTVVPSGYAPVTHLQVKAV